MYLADEAIDREGALTRLKWALQGLASSGSTQPTLFPESSRSANDLAAEFDSWCEIVRSRFGTDLTDAQLDALAAIDGKLRTMSRDGAEFDAELWSDAALASSEHWTELRRLAVAALTAFAWPLEGVSDESSGGESSPE